ncbi:NADPH-dependent pterin aldehyde reductase [Ananas comosus]|uniref:NADPH-dependent pterin aldehyde reductase n=1 Tax=Ananas comosus TaxID=4615 RepID=A0A199UGC0_ANACO|nr:NADPH-dependent pterin aldehyde reductase [Ananas comosus]
MTKGAAGAAGAGKKTVLITGASRGLGRALAVEMARRGHAVVGCARSHDALHSLHADLHPSPSSPSPSPSPHLLTTADVRSDGSVRELAKLVAESRRVPDIIVNNAGAINKNNKIWLVPAEEFDMVVDTNIKGTTNILRHFLPLMIEKKQGIVVNISSGWGRSAAAEVAPYCATKWAIEGLTRSVAKELPPGVAIIALSPGVVNTDMLASCFGSSAALYQTPDAWAPKAATMILNLTTEDNGASLTV